MLRPLKSLPHYRGYSHFQGEIVPDPYIFAYVLKHHSFLSNITSVFTSHRTDARVGSPGFHHMTVPGNQPKKKKKTRKTSFSESAVT